MKIKIPMVPIYGIINTLKKQDTPEAKEAIRQLEDIFGPLLHDCEMYLMPPTYEAEVDPACEEGHSEKSSNINQEQRRYELVKDFMAAQMTMHPNFNWDDSSNMKSLLIRATRQADFVLEGLKQPDILKWKGTYLFPKGRQ